MRAKGDEGRSPRHQALLQVSMMYTLQRSLASTEPHSATRLPPLQGEANHKISWGIPGSAVLKSLWMREGGRVPPTE